MNELSVKSDVNIMLFDEGKLSQLMKFAEFMSGSGLAIPVHLQGKPADCFAIAMQAVQWGMDPFAVARKTYFVNHAISFEAQLVNAAVSTSRAIKGAFKYKYGGDWEKIVGTKPPTKAGWGNKEEGLYVSVGAILAGEDDITWGEPVYLANVTTRNSPLWANHVKQQISYLAVNMWARMYTPAVILGVYTPEEVAAHDITPPTGHEDEQKAKLEAHKEKVKAAGAKKESTVIEGTAEEVTEVASSEPEPEKPLTLKAFEKLLAETNSPAELKNRQNEVEAMRGANKAKASKAFKERLAILKALEQEKEPRAIDEAYKLLNLSKSSDDIDVASDHVLTLNQEGRVTLDEINDFQIASDKKLSSLAES